MTKHYSVTEDELTQIKNDCYYPNVLSCDGCKFVDETCGCNWKGANILQDEIMERPDSLDILEAWIDACDCGGLPHNNLQEILTKDIGDCYDYDIFKAMIREMRNDLQSVIERGIREEWWKV